MQSWSRAHLRWGFALVAAAVVLADLAWQHVHGGIASHHLLHRPDLPAVSNAWGLLLVPLLAWWVSGRIWRSSAAAAVDGKTIAGLVAALVFGAVLVLAFEHGYDVIPRYLLLGAAILALVLPIYRVEYLFGFVLGTMLTFGAVLPAMLGAVLAAWSALWHRLLWPGFGLLVARLRRPRGPGEYAGRRSWR